MPSLNPNRFRGVCWLRDVEDVRPKPSWDQRTADLAEADAGKVADGVDGHLGIVGAGLDHDVAAGAAGLEVVAREVRQVDQCPGPPPLEPEAGLAVLLEQRRRRSRRSG